MNIIIAGAGKVGFNLAKTLCIGHNVTIIDKNIEALDRIQESLDILPLQGDVENSDIYEGLTSSDIDLFIAVTNIDNVNLVAIAVAGTVLNIKTSFVRLQKHFFNKEIIQDKFFIDHMIFPTKLSSEGVASLLRYPLANNVKIFKYTPLKLISILISSKTIPQTIDDERFKIVGIERKKNFFIPSRDNEILPNDLVYFFGEEEAILGICETLKLQSVIPVQKCVVFGGGELGIAIAKELLKAEKDVKLIEKDIELCEAADEALEGKVSILNYQYNSHDIFEDEGLTDADIFIAATSDDEYNIIKSLEAKESGMKKVLAINNEMQYYNLMHSLGIIVVRGPKISAYNTIIEEINSNGVVIQKSYCGAKALVFMRKIYPASKLIGKQVKRINVEESSLFYLREDILRNFDEKVVLQENDLVIAFSTTKESAKVKQWIYEL